MNKVNINQDMTKYLPSNSSMKKGLDILEKEFHNMTISYDKFIYNFFKDNDECKIDLIDFLIENDMYEVVTNLLISYQADYRYIP